MDRFEKHLDKIIDKVLNEAIQDRAEEIVNKINERVDQNEALSGGQKKLDKNKNNKIDAEDFKLLRLNKKKDMKEYTMGDVEPDHDVEPYGNFDTEKVKIGKVKNSGFKYEKEVGKEFNEGEMGEEMYGSFGHLRRKDSKGDTYYDELARNPKDSDIYGIGDDEMFDTEEFETFKQLYDKYGDKQKWFSKNDGERMFDLYKQKTGKPFKVKTRKLEGEMEEGKHSKAELDAFVKYIKDSMGSKDKDRDDHDGRNSRVVGVYSNINKQRMGEEDETVEGNEFSGELAKARKEGKKSFTVDGKTYPVKEAKDEKWIQDVDMKKGAFTKYCKGKVTCDCVKTAMGKKGHPQKMAQMYLNMNPDKCKSLQENTIKKNIQLSEDELITLIERLVNEQYMKMQKDTAKVEKENGAINQDHIVATKKKMNQYLKDGSEGDYEMDPENFPMGNGEMKDMPKKAYKASDAVEEYIDAFAYPGMTNLVYDEIKPNDEWIEANLKGSSKTGNAQVDDDGNPLGNVVPTKTGDKMYKNFKDNVYGAEQMNASYKRYPQPVDQAGESTEDGDLKLKKGSQKSEKIFKQLESTEDKSSKLIQEQIDRMKNMVNYNQKTQ